jgi:hypothetical protein
VKRNFAVAGSVAEEKSTQRGNETAEKVEAMKAINKDLGQREWKGLNLAD